MKPFFIVYMTCWMTLCVVAAFLAVRIRDTLAIYHRSYRRFLFTPWKGVTFLIATSILTLMAPYTGDSTWDYFDAFFMSVLTFLTAPWVVGVLYKAFRREIPATQTFVAICVWMFTASWSYDLYITLRDGEYSPLWWQNIFASSGLYIMAGLFWNLEWTKDRGTVFGFMEADWPAPSPGSGFGKVFWMALLFMFIVSCLMLPFLVDIPIISE